MQQRVCLLRRALLQNWQHVLHHSAGVLQCSCDKLHDGGCMPGLVTQPGDCIVSKGLCWGHPQVP
jgi:hypothetical protein